MKIGILTINDYNNYGNRLQNYALQEVLKSLGHEPYTIRNLVVNDRRNRMVRNLAKINRIRKKIAIQHKNEFDFIREKAFVQFNNQYIRETNFSIKKLGDKPKELNSFDAFIIGSDQVWNYHFMRFSPIDFALFSKRSQKVISYAASFGVESIPDKLIEEYRRGLNNLDAISVRENAGKKIVDKILENDVAKIVADPTFLLTPDKWMKIVSDTASPLVSKNYVVTYFLGSPSDEEWMYINNYAQSRGLEVINFNRRNEKAWGFGPSEFINYLNNAVAVFTDSFHACVFSIQFRKEFEVFKRRDKKLESMNSRIETLLSRFELEDRVYNNESKSKIDYSKIENIMNDTISNSVEFLDRSLNI